MSKMDIVRYCDRSYEKPIALIGFPSVGLVGSIISSFIVRELKMEVIAGITSSDLPPYTLIQYGNPYPPVRVYGCTMENSSESCGDLVIVTSEASPKPEQCYDIADALMELFESLGIKTVIAIEGIPQMSEDGTIMACGSSDSARKMIDDLGLRRLDDGLVRGTTGVLLYKGFLKGMDVISMLCPASPTLPDPRAAASILGPLASIIPDLKLNVEPLFKEAEEMERRIKEQEESSQTGDIQQLYG